MRIISVLALIAAFFIAPGAHALSIDRMTSVSDGTGGSLSISTQSTSAAGSGSSHTTLVASAFSPGGSGSISGTIDRDGDRSGESSTAVYNGNVTITTRNAAGNPVNVVVGLTNLTVAREGDGADYSGTVTINGRPFDASQLPENARRMVANLLRMFRFA